MEQLKRKVYSEWAFKENESQKRQINSEIYKELMQKWRISYGTDKWNPDTMQREPINIDDYDLVYTRTAGHLHSEYHILKNETDMTDDELALIFDRGNLCFGYKKERNDFFYVFED